MIGMINGLIIPMWRGKLYSRVLSLMLNNISLMMLRKIMMCGRKISN